MDQALEGIAQARAQGGGRPAWPVIVSHTPKGWTGPAVVDGAPVEGTWRSHQVPLAAMRENPEHLRQLEEWLRSYRPQELFDADGRPTEQVLACVPDGELRLGANPPANGGLLTRVAADSAEHRDFRVVGSDETASNRLEAIFDVTGKAWQAEILETDEHLARDGRVMEILSEHLCQGWLEGHNLTGRQGLFSCYEAFVHVVCPMRNTRTACRTWSTTRCSPRTSR